MRIESGWKWKRFSFRNCVPVVVFALIFFLFVPVTRAEEEAVRPARITQQISAGAMVELRGSVHRLTAKARDLGAVDPALQLESMRLDISPSAAEQKEIESLMAAQQQPSSPHYHKWLTQQEYGALFGLGESDLQKIKEWLLSQGFAIVAVSPARNTVTFSGTVAQAEAAFQTRMHRFEWRGETRMANATALHIPAALAGVVTHVGGLQGFRLQPKVKPNPRFTSSYPGYHALSPADWATIYNVNAIYNAGYTGTGMHVGIVGQTYFPQSDVDGFRAVAGLSATSLNMVCLSANTSDDPCTGDDAVSLDDLTEADLDVEWAGGIAKNATVDFIYYGAQSYLSAIDALQDAITTYTVNGKVLPVISSSYGICEPEVKDYNGSYDAAISEAALQGQTILSAAGDSGAADCDQYSPASGGLAVDWPGSNPNVVSVGGSTFNDGGSAANPEEGADPPFWTYNSSADTVSTAQQYIPEVAWNDTAFDDSYGYSDLVSGGGGVSTLYSHPSWQATPTGFTGAVMRFVPDVSFSASADYVPYLICTQEFPDGTISPSQPSCVDNTFWDNSGYLSAVGGTSAGTPSFAGMLTLLVQKYGSLGSINPVLYSLASNSTTYAEVFHDITVGDNIQPCAYQSPNCVGGSSTANGTMGYSAQTGYDLATGLGSVNGGALMAVLSPWPTPLVLSISTSSGSSGTTITVAGANFTGSSLVLWNGFALATTYVNSTELTATIPASDLENAGTALITVTNVSGTSAAMPLTNVNSGQAPSISGVSILESSGSYVLAVLGENFFSGSHVLWNGSSRTTTYLGPGLLSAAISAADYASRPATVTVTGSNGSSAGFTFH